MRGKTTRLFQVLFFAVTGLAFGQTYTDNTPPQGILNSTNIVLTPVAADSETLVAPASVTNVYGTFIHRKPAWAKGCRIYVLPTFPGSQNTGKSLTGIALNPITLAPVVDATWQILDISNFANNTQQSCGMFPGIDDGNIYWNDFRDLSAPVPNVFKLGIISASTSGAITIVTTTEWLY